MKIADHQLTIAQQWQSPNQDHRPAGEISLIVVHGISLPAGEFGGDAVSSLFCNTLDTDLVGLTDLKGVEVSSHLFIRRDGDIHQFVDFNQRAWHAGVSIWRGRENCNDFAVGIELEGTDRSPYEAVQYKKLAEVCASLMKHYGAMDVAGHCHIAPERKTDPGDSFNWLYLQRLLARQL